MSNLIAETVAWLAATGPPNGVFVIALLTHPAIWSDEAVRRLRPLLDRVLPKRKKETEDAGKAGAEEGA